MRKKVNKKLIVALLSFVLLFGGTFGSSLAWLLDKTDNVQNTFTTSNINITLTETGTTTKDGIEKKDFQMVPGCTVSKDPKVTVLKNSVDCWVFVEVVESDNLDSYIEYSLADGWTALGEDYPNIYYYEDYVPMSTEQDKIISILKDDEVTTKSTVDKDMMDALEEGTEMKPTLTFKAYASQYMKDNEESFDVVAAWKNVAGTGEADSGSEPSTTTP